MTDRASYPSVALDLNDGEAHDALPSRRILVAGLGNIFKGDDGFGSAVLQRLVERSWPPGVKVEDFGIRGVHLAYELLDGYDLVVLVDAIHRDGPAGTLYVVKPDAADADENAHEDAMVDAHDMTPAAVLSLVPRLGGELGDVVLVGCEPQVLVEKMGLSEVVATSVDRAADMVSNIVEERSRSR
ncbi:MAG: hydrogenase maturation protease [Nocardioides sp.]|nr:hydrogenase maturation protease [Nocardioides sp.]